MIILVGQQLKETVLANSSQRHRLNKYRVRFVTGTKTLDNELTADREINEWLTIKRTKPNFANKMFLQWCGAVLVISFYLRSTFGFGDRTRLRKRTTAQTQTLATIEFSSPTD